MSQLLQQLVQNHAFNGVESKWLIFASLSISVNPVVVCDPSLYPKGLRLHLAVGDYEAAAKLFEYEGAPFIARFRILRRGARADSLRRLDDLSVDFGRVTLGEDASIADAGSKMSAEDVEAFGESLRSGSLAGLVRWGRFLTPYVECGTFGAGVYPVCEISDAGTAVGVDIDLLGEDRTEVLR